MATKTHTAGPWHYGKTGNPCGDLSVYADHLTAYDLAYVRNVGNDAETLANARLMSAAPAMYEHALMVVRLYGTDHPKGLVELKEAVANLREALRKADGAGL